MYTCTFSELVYACLRDCVLSSTFFLQEQTVHEWMDQGLMTKIQKKKLVFVETTDNAEMSMALANYRKVCAECSLAVTETMIRDWPC